MYIFHKFYYANDLEKYNYVDVAVTCCYLITKIQDSILTKVHKVKDFLVYTQRVWMKIRNRKLDDLVYILPRLECIIYHGIGFDLSLDIPHKYVVECFRMSMNMKPAEVDALVPNAQKPSDSVRHFLRYCLFSQLCVDTRYDARSLAAAAVDYALSASQIKCNKPDWLQKMNISPSAVGHQQLTPALIEDIQKERKRISMKVNSFSESAKHTSPIPPEDHKQGAFDETRKRTRPSSPVVEPIGQKQPRVMSLQVDQKQSPVIPSQVDQKQSLKLPSLSQNPSLVIPSQVDQKQSLKLPSPRPTFIRMSTDPAPLISTESSSSDPPPLFATPASTQSLPSMLLHSESIDSPAPLFAAQSLVPDQEEIPLFSF